MLIPFTCIFYYFNICTIKYTSKKHLSNTFGVTVWINHKYKPLVSEIECVILNNTNLINITIHLYYSMYISIIYKNKENQAIRYG